MKDHARVAVAVLLAAGCVNLERPPELSVLSPPDGALPDRAATADDAADAAAAADLAATDAAEPAPDGGPAPKGPDAAPDAPGAGTDVAVQLRSNGEACSTTGQCQSGNCVDGVCCVTACAGDCYACNVPEVEGRCVPAAEGTDPRGTCPREEPATCRYDGACDGRGGCRMHSPTTECGPGACVGATESAARFCDGAGTCRPPASNRSCSPNVCSGSSCGTRCTSTGECQMGFSCSNGVCIAAAGRPVLHWTFDEADGTAASDASGNGFHGTYGGASGSMPSPSTDVPVVQFPDPRSRTFVSTYRQTVRLAPLPGALKVSSGVTLSVWFRSSGVSGSSGYAEIVSVGDGYILIFDRGYIGLMKRTSRTYDWCWYATTRHLDGRWHHVAGVATATEIKTYVDGVERCSRINNDPITYSATPELVVGRDPDPRYPYYFDGAIDDLRIYTRVLSATELTALAAGAN